MNRYPVSGAFLDRAQNWSATQTFLDSITLLFGTGGDASLSYNGTHFIVNPIVVGSGAIVLGSGEGGTTLATGATVRGPDITTGGAGNIAGADVTFAAPLGTGTGDEGTFIFQLPIVATAGDNIQTRATRLTLDMAGSTTVLTMAAAQAMTVSTAAGNLTLNPAGIIVLKPGASQGVGIDYAVDASVPSIYRSGTNADYIEISGGATSVTGGVIQLYGQGHANASKVILRTRTNVGAEMSDRLTISGTVATAVATWTSIYHVGLKYGLAGTATGAFTMDGATSGVVTVTVAAIAGTWTMTLPTGVAGTGGFQLTDAAGDGVTSWAAAGSRLAYKVLLPETEWLTPQDALDRILHTRVPAFHFALGKGTQDAKTRYDGVIADADWEGSAPWAMHYAGGILNPISAFGHTVLGFQAMDARLTVLEADDWLKQQLRAKKDDPELRQLMRELLEV